MDYQTYKLLKVAEQAQSDVNGLIGYLQFSAVVLALVPPIPRTWNGIFWRTVFVTLVIWNAVGKFRGYEVRWTRTIYDIEQKNPGYDGVGGNAGVFLFGWIIPFLQCLGVLLFIKLATLTIRRLRTKTTMAPTPPEKAPESES